MITADQFEKMRHFIFQHGDLLTRKRFMFHFENGGERAVLDVLACYQNEDGGFGNGLELDVLCPESSGICTEMAFRYLIELNSFSGPIFERGLAWVVNNSTPNGDLPHPLDALKRYPHGEWWARADSGRIMSVAGLLGKAGMGRPDISARAATIFEASYVPLPKKLGVYSYPLNLYLEYAEGSDKYAEYRDLLRAAFPKVLEQDAWHHPLFFCHDHWASDNIPLSLWRQEAQRAASTLQDDGGGVRVDRYESIPSYQSWRPVWTLDMLVTMRNRGVLNTESQQAIAH